jgi:hypothetical protein
LYEPFQLPIPRQTLDKDQLRAQTESLRGVANLSARTAIQQHSLRMRKAELVAKGVLTTVAIVIGGFLMAVYARFGSEYLWHVVAGFATVIFVMYDFLVSFQRLSEAAKPVEAPEPVEEAVASIEVAKPVADAPRPAITLTPHEQSEAATPVAAATVEEPAVAEPVGGDVTLSEVLAVSEESKTAPATPQEADPQTADAHGAPEPEAAKAESE